MILSLCADGISAVEFAQPSHDSAAARRTVNISTRLSVVEENIVCLLGVKIKKEVGRITEGLDVGKFYDFNLHRLYLYFI